MFRMATVGADGSSKEPFPYQSRFANAEGLPDVLRAPTGAGKTATVVLGWIWRRFFHPSETMRESTPRRLVYCLPMRTLVVQVVEDVRKWLANLGLDSDDGISVTMLMGGSERGDWDAFPERESIIVGTQDMLLSRALNRGYGMNIHRSPMHFAWLNNDCLWVMDETQLMGVGVETSSQLQGFRRMFGTEAPTHTIWMSATMDEDRLDTIDHPAPEDGWSEADLSQEDISNPVLSRRWEARKRVSRCDISTMGQEDYAEELAGFVSENRSIDGRTLVILNTVSRAQGVYEAVKRALPGVDVTLLHSRFRGGDRKNVSDIGDVVISTQVVEAGVDISSEALITELAPWSSMVQRAGRCNRYGEYGTARVHWIDVPEDPNPKEAKKSAMPYGVEDLTISRDIISGLDDMGPASLSTIDHKSKSEEVMMVRKRDLEDLFDISSDLSGNHMDISGFVREADDNDVLVYWRGIPGNGPNDDMRGPWMEEFCRVPVGDFKAFVKKVNKKDVPNPWTYSPVSEGWREVGPNDTIVPGMTFLMDSKTGGYTEEMGWVGSKSMEPVEPMIAAKEGGSKDDEPRGGSWITLEEHTSNVVRETNLLSEKLGIKVPYRDSLECAALWHDVGKAHEAFQNFMEECGAVHDGTLWARPPGNFGYRGYHVETSDGKVARHHFRHELASTMSFMANGAEIDPLAAWAIASHHGKVGMRIRSNPNEVPHSDGLPFALGVWQGDIIPPFRLAGFDGGSIDMSPISMGRGSWTERSLDLLEDMGPFRLSYLSSLLRVADWRAAAKERGSIDE